MSDKAGKDSAYRKEYQDFITKLQKFHDSKRTTFTKIPSFGGKDLDLLLLYKTVTSLGGFSKVTDEKKWSEVVKCLNLPLKCTNGAFALRQHYIRYLEHYERVNFFGEDTEDTVVDGTRQSLSLTGARTPLPGTSFVAPGNTDIIKPPALGPLGELKTHNFNKLMFSLASGLPNEVDFALNICTLLSNVTNSIFNLAKAPGIVDLMLLHAGIWTTETLNAEDMYKEWYQESERDFVKFWREALDDNCAKELFESGLSGSDLVERINTLHEVDDYREHFADCTVDVNHAETNRVLQICVILHNFSFEDLNAMFLATHRGAKRFLMLCAGTKQAALRKIALDTLDNLADRFTLTRLVDHENQKLLEMLHNFLESRDRLRRVRAMTILAKLASCEDNEELLSEGMTLSAYESLIRSLTIPDIQIILASLDSLYFLSHLGEVTATSIAMVYGAIDVLICLITVHAESYGNRAIAGFRIVENKNSICSQKNNSMLAAQRALKPPVMRHGPAQAPHPPAPPGLPPQPFLRTPIPPVRPPQLMPETVPQLQPDGDETEEIDPEVFTAQWISAFYELSPGHTISRSDMYSDYLVTCNRLGRLGILPAVNFNKILRMVIPEQHLQGAQTNQEGYYSIAGVKRRATPLPVQSRVPRQRASVPVVGIHGSPRPNAFPPNIVQNQRLQGPPLPFQRPVASPYMAGQRPALSPDTFQQSRPRPQYEGVPFLQGARGGPPPLTGPGPGQQVNASPPIDQTSQGAPKDGIIKDTGPKPTPLLNTPGNEAGTHPSDVPPNVCISTSSPGGPLPPNSISLPVTSGAQAQDGIAQYQTATEHIKREMQQHFMQFHFHRQQIQNIQAQLQQAVQQSQLQQLPQNVMEEIQTKVQSHHSQMQMHYQKLQQLQMLMQRVQQKAAQEQLSAKENVKDTPHASPKSKRGKKNLAQASKTSAPGAVNLLEKFGPQQRGPPQSPSMPGSPGQPNPAGLPPSSPLPTNNLQQMIGGTGTMVESRRTENTTLPNDASKVPLPPQPQPGTPMFNGLQGSVSDSRASDQPHIPRTVPPGENAMSTLPVPSTDMTNTALLQQPMATSAADKSPAVIYNAIPQPGGKQMQPDLSNSLNQKPNPTSVAPPPAQPVQTSIALPNSVTVSGMQVINPNNHPARFMILQAPPQVLPQNGAPRPYPQNPMLMIPPVAAATFSPIVGRLPIMRNQSPQPENRKQPILPKDYPNNAPVSQIQKPTLPLVRLQGSFSPMLPPQSIAVAQPNVSLSSVPSSSLSVSAPTNVDQTQQPTVNPQQNNPLLPSNSIAPSTSGNDVLTSTHSRVAGNTSIPIHQQNGSLHNAGKLNPGQDVQSHNRPAVEDGKCADGNKALSGLSKSTGLTANTIGQFNRDEPGQGNLEYVPVNIARDSENGLTMPKSHARVEPGKRHSDDLSEKESMDKDTKRLKLAEEVSKLEKQEKTVLNGVLESRLLQKHERNSEKTDLWLNGLHSPNIIKNKENGLSKHIDLITDGEPLTKLSNSEDPQKKTFNELETHSGQQCKTNLDKSREKLLNDIKENPSSEIGKEPGGDAKVSSSNEDSSDVKESEQDVIENGVPKQSGKITTTDLSPVENKRMCLWEGCNSSFLTNSNLLSHMVCAHAPVEGQLGICRIQGCSNVQRPRGSMICHFQQRHCNQSGSGDDLPLVTLPELLFPKVADLEKKEDESPVTRSVRLTSALILRNIARNSSYGRQLIRAFEGKLVLSAMSTSEASGAVASCLAELSKRRTSSRVSISDQDS